VRHPSFVLSLGIASISSLAEFVTRNRSNGHGALKSQAYTKRIAKIKAVWVKPVLQAEKDERSWYFCPDIGY
jgi:hypothetical protein